MPASQQYELTYILDEKATQETATAKTAELKKFIASLDGKIEKEEAWGRRELAYIIKRNRSGFYVTLWLTLPAPQLRALEEHLRFDESIIRSLVTKAYEHAQPGSLYPVAEEEVKSATDKSENATAEESLRRSTGISRKKKEEELLEDEMPEEERLKKLDETLDTILKDGEE